MTQFQLQESSLTSLYHCERSQWKIGNQPSESQMYLKSSSLKYFRDYVEGRHEILDLFLFRYEGELGKHLKEKVKFSQSIKRIQIIEGSPNEILSY